MGRRILELIENTVFATWDQMCFTGLPTYFAAVSSF